MFYLSEKEYKKKLKKIQEKNESKERKELLKAEKHKFKQKRKKMSTSKVALAVMFLICVEIIIFSEWVMYNLKDMTALYALIGVPVALAPVIWGYYSKSKAENTKGGITYETAMYNKQSCETDGMI